MRMGFQKFVPKILGLTGGLSHDKYLGLPTMVGRNERQTFNSVKEILWKMVRNWKGNFFSIGGKKILIKAIAQAVPTYTMSLFQLSVALCKYLGSMISNFW
ncbi:hypothetical protein ACOSQ2_005171 [Xanthoceras sorbifolium]